MSENKEYLSKNYVNPFYIYILDSSSEMDKAVFKKHAPKDLIDSLEKIVNQFDLQKTKTTRGHLYNLNKSQNYQSLLEDYFVNNNKNSLEEFLNKTESTVEIETGDLPPGVLGMYDLRTDTVYIKSGLSSELRDFVRAHEHAHRRRAYAGESQDEAQVDREAERKTGYSINRHAA